MPISEDGYNKARGVLVQAGSKTAEKSHPKHNVDKVPDDHGKSLLQEARDEFRKMDQGQPGLTSEMLPAHNDAIHKAAGVMGITEW